MAYSDIYNKFLIEYDKQNITSSYPSLLKKEICLILDKAYLALITLKFTGNNTRKAAFGIDAKQTIDLQGLIALQNIESFIIPQENNLYHSNTISYSNEILFKITSDFLYFISGTVKYEQSRENLVFISPEASLKYGITERNNPIIKTPAFFIRSGYAHLFYDTKTHDVGPSIVHIQYIRKPETFYENNDVRNVDFQLNDAAAEELINLAVIFALENVESQRTNSKITVSLMEG